MVKIINILIIFIITTSLVAKSNDIYKLINENNYSEVFKEYQRSNLMKIRKDKKIIEFLSKKVLINLKNIKENEKISYIKKYLIILPYSKELFQKYLDLKWSKKFSINSIYDFIEYKNMFGYNQLYFNKLIFYSLKYLYKKEKDQRYVSLMARIDIKESTNMVEKLIKEKNYFLLAKLKKIPSLKLESLKELIISKEFYYKKDLIKQFLQKSNKAELINLYKDLSLNNKINIYFNYYKLTNEEIDLNLINFLLRKDSKNYHKVAFDLVKKLNIKKYADKLIKFVPIYQGKCSSIRTLLIDTLIDIKPSFVINFLEKIDTEKLKNIQKIELCNFKERLLIKQTCNFPEIISNGTNNEKEKYLELILKQKRDIPKYYLDNKNNYLSIFSDNYKNIDKNLLKEIAYLAYKKGKYDLLLNYYSTLTLKELLSIKLKLTETKKSDIPKFVKRAKLGQDTLQKILMISLIKKDYYEIFNLKKYIEKKSINSVNFIKLVISVIKKEELFWLLRIANSNINEKILKNILENIIEVENR